MNDQETAPKKQKTSTGHTLATAALSVVLNHRISDELKEVHELHEVNELLASTVEHQKKIIPLQRRFINDLQSDLEVRRAGNARIQAAQRGEIEAMSNMVKLLLAQARETELRHQNQLEHERREMGAMIEKLQDRIRSHDSSS
jgi:hypothetical protein